MVVLVPAPVGGEGTGGLVEGDVLHVEPHALQKGAEADLHRKDTDRAGERAPLGVDRHSEAGNPVAPRRGHLPHRDDRRLLLGQLRERLTDRFAGRGRTPR